MPRKLVLVFVLAPLLSAGALAQTAPPPVMAADDLVNAPDIRTELEPLDDAKILEITHLANSGEIAQAKLAMRRATSAGVKRLARTIITDHGKADRDGMRVAGQRGLALADSGISKELRADAETTLAELDARRDPAFDRAYVDAQIRQHEHVLRLIDDKLLGSAHDAAVKSYLRNIRPHIQMHLDQAKALKETLKEKTA